MKYLDLSYVEPMLNLACDEALIDACAGEQDEGILRVWEARQHFIVAGYSNKIATEINQAACAADGVPILRRCTGGGAVLQGPGCLNYALVFNYRESEMLGDLNRSYEFVLERHRRVFAELIGAPVTVSGTSDLAVGEKKFSGNSQYRKRRQILIHGTFLLHFDVDRIERYLRMPSKQPNYRKQRSHREFVLKLGIETGIVKRALREAWNAWQKADAPSSSDLDSLVRERYSRPEWNFKF